MKNYFKSNTKIIVLILLTVFFLSAYDSTIAATIQPETKVKSSPKADKHKSEWDKILQEAKKEGRVVIQGPPGKVYRDAIFYFEKQYPEIKIEYQGVTGRDFRPKIITEQSTGQFLWDITFGPDLPIETLDIFYRDLPETVSGVDDDKWIKGFDYGFLDVEKKYRYAFTSYVSGAFVNRDFISERDLKNIPDLLNPIFIDKISWNDPRQTGSGAAMGANLLINYGEEFLYKLLSKQKIAVTLDLRQQIDWLVRGTYPVAFGISQGTLNEYKEKGLGLNVKRIEDPKSVNLSQGYGVVNFVKKAPHINAAKVFVNWLLSKEGQTIWATTTGVNSRRIGVPIPSKDQYPSPDTNYPFLGKEIFLPDRAKAIKIAEKALADRNKK